MEAKWWFGMKLILGDMIELLVQTYLKPELYLAVFIRPVLDGFSSIRHIV
jgi:hypothetical protein